MTRHIVRATAAALLLLPGRAHAQADTAGVLAQTPAPGQYTWTQFEFVVAQPIEEEPVVKGAPFSAEAVTEFTQVLGDGNRIDRRFTTSLWRDSQGRTRREQQIALVGPLAVQGDPPRLVTIFDPVAGVSYTLNEQTRTANGQRTGLTYSYSINKSVTRTGTSQTNETAVAVDFAALDQPVAATRAAAGLPGAAGKKKYIGSPAGVQGQAIGGAFFEQAAVPSSVKTEPLGTRAIEGVAAEGTRTTTTIPAGAVGNLAPIEVVNERWFSKELQTAVLIMQRDPRSGETVYRLTNVVRAEPAADLFAVPSTYTITSPKKAIFAPVRP